MPSSASAPTLPDLAADDRWLNLDEAAAYLGAGYSTVRLWIRQGRLEAVKVGRRYKVRLSDLDAMVSASTVDPVEAHIDALVAAAPPLSDSQVRRLQSLLGGVAA